ESILDDSDAAYLRAFRVNTLGVVHGIRCVAPVMLKGSSIITISSLSSLLGAPLLGAYAASKAALAAVTRTSALELAPRGIRVNEVAPGAVRTAMNDSGARFVERELAWVKAAGAFGRMAEPEEIAAVVHFLASDDCQMITGQTLVVDGGLTAGPSLGLLDTLVERDNQ
ncbi:MAG: SDR family oxidoreductase, partial [Actinobacteria bacterium]|nr:SDR family oxidoreductase [Actinomycetota bacterium]